MPIVASDNFSGVSGIWTDITTDGTVVVAGGVKTVSNIVGTYTGCGFYLTAGVAPKPLMKFSMTASNASGAAVFVYFLVRTTAGIAENLGYGFGINNFNSATGASAVGNGAGLFAFNSGALSTPHLMEMILTPADTAKFYYDSVFQFESSATGLLAQPLVYPMITQFYTPPTALDDFSVSFTEDDGYDESLNAIAAQDIIGKRRK